MSVGLPSALYQLDFCVKKIDLIHHDAFLTGFLGLLYLLYIMAL